MMIFSGSLGLCGLSLLLTHRYIVTKTSMDWGNPHQGMDRTQLVDGLSRTLYRTGVDLSGLRQYSRSSGHLDARSDVGGT